MVKRPAPTRTPMRDVDLVETDLDDVAPGVPAATLAAPGRPWRERRGGHSPAAGRPSHHGAWAALVSVLVLGVAVSGVGEDETWPTAAELARSPGVLARVEGPVAPAWSSPVSMWTGAASVDGLLVGVANVPTGGTGVVALRADTGAVVWRALPSTDGRTSALGCATSAAAPAGGPGVVTCLVTERAWARVDRPATMHVVRLDAGSGDVLEREVVDRVTAAATWQALVSRPASTVPLGDGRPAGFDLTDGGRLSIDAGRPGSRRWRVQGRFAPMDVLVVGSRVLTSDEHAVTCHDSASGAELWVRPVERVGRAALVTDGRLVLVTAREPSGAVVVTALAVADGRPRWTVDVDDDLRLVVLANRLYGLGPDRLVALR